MIFDAFALLVSKAAFIGLRLFVLYLLAATLGGAEFGPLAFALTLAELARFVADWGIDTLSLRLFSTPDDVTASSKFRATLRIKLLSAVAGFALSFSGILLFAGVSSIAAAGLIAMTTVTSLWLNLAVNWLQARSRLRRAALWLCVTGAGAIAIQLAIHLAEWGYVSRLAILVGIELLMAALVLRLAQTSLAARAHSQSKEQIGEWFIEATPIAIAMILALSYARFDQIYIRAFYPDAVLGEFTLAARLVEPVLFVAASMTSTIYARASARVLGGAGRAEMRAMARKWIGLAIAVGLAVALIMGIAGHYAAHWLFPAYVRTPTFLLIALAALPFRCVNLCLTAFIQAQGQFRRMLLINFANFLNIAILVIAGGAAFGYIGAAFAVVVGEAINSLIQTRTLTSLLKGQDA